MQNFKIFFLSDYKLFFFFLKETRIPLQYFFVIFFFLVCVVK